MPRCGAGERRRPIRRTSYAYERICGRFSALDVEAGGGSLGAVPVGRSVRPTAPLIQQIIDLLFQPRKIISDGIRDNLDIHIKVIVDHLVAHAPHFDPW